MEMQVLAKSLENVLAYARGVVGYADMDFYFIRNAFLDMLKIDKPEDPVPATTEGDIDVLMLPIVERLYELGLVKEETAEQDVMRAYAMLLPTPGWVSDHFYALAEKSVFKACEWLYKIEVLSGYIPEKAINKNPQWVFEGKHGPICITINTAKPEKDPKEVARAKAMPQTGYPRCMLCVENLGYPGRIGYPNRQNLRYIPVHLGEGSDWVVQYSPYRYFTNHSIFINANHVPMVMNESTLKHLADLTHVFPFYFVGSNAPLPIVGGSILAHEHFQGGAKVHPIFPRKTLRGYTHPSFEGVTFGVLDWYNSVVRIEGKNKDSVIKAGAFVNNAWAMYSDAKAGIVSRTGDIPHNCVTPAYHIEDGVETLDLILRNNRTDIKHPYGIYHPTEDMHHIKKEAIGIIEVMGTFILPGRLKGELEGVAKILCGEVPFDEKSLSDSTNPLNKHKNMIVSLLKEAGISADFEGAMERVQSYLEDVCERILECTAVFKNNEEGLSAFDKFLTSIGCTPTTCSTLDTAVENAAKKRGRPKKVEETKTDIESTTEADAPKDAPARKRGRPKKNA